MPKDKWRNYATKNRLIQKGYFKKYIYGSQSGKAAKASCGDSVFESREEQKEVMMNAVSNFIGKLASEDKDKEKAIVDYGREVVLTEEVVFVGDKENFTKNKEIDIPMEKPKKKKVKKK